MGLLDRLQGILGSYEGAASVGSGILAQPISGLAGILALPGGPEKAAAAVRGTQNALTYQPRTDAGQNALRSFGNAMEPVTNALQRVQQASGDAGYAMGGPVGGMLGATLPDAAMMALPLGMRTRTPQAFPLPMQREAGAVVFGNKAIPATQAVPLNIPAQMSDKFAMTPSRQVAFFRENMDLKLSQLPDGKYAISHSPQWGAKAKEFSVTGDSVDEALNAAQQRLARGEAATKAATSRSLIGMLQNEYGDVFKLSNSTQSKSKYIEHLPTGTKIRISDHDLPLGYVQPDVDLRAGMTPKEQYSEIVKALSAEK